jgi:antitoxin component YwqK of YwqJK toxin-antitoxin module
VTARPPKEGYLYSGHTTIGKLVVRSAGHFPQASFIRSFKTYDAAGAVTFTYTEGETGNVLVDRRDEKGNPLDKLYFGRDSILIRETWTKNSRLRVSYMNLPYYYSSSIYRPLKEERHKDGELVYLDYQYPNHLNNEYPDSLGFVLSELHKSKRETRASYYLLRNGFTRSVTTRKKLHKSYGQFDYEVIKSAQDTVLKLSRVAYSKDGKFKVVHEKTMKYPTFPDFSINDDKSMFDDWTESALDKFQDTIIYKTFYNDKLITGTVRLTKKRGFNWSSMGIVKVKTYPYGNKEYKVPMVWNRYDQKSLRVHKGVPNGTMSLGWSANVSYDHGLKDGDVSTYSESGYYARGQKHGRFSSKTSTAEYKYNKLSGEYTETKLYLRSKHTSQVNLRAHYKEDTLHGRLQRYAEPHVTYEDAYFQNGILHGDYSSGTQVHNKLLDVTLEKGLLVDTGRYYFKEGNVKCLVSYSAEDKVLPVTGRSGPSLDSYDSSEWDAVLQNFYKYKAARVKPENTSNNYAYQNIFVTFNALLTGDYEYYYKSGVISMAGRIENGAKVGSWRYFDVNGGLHKEVLYDSGVYVVPNTGDSITYYGKITSYHPNGKLLLKGLVKDETSRFKCEIEQSITMEQVHYLEFYDSKGNQLISETGGYVYQYYNDGTVSMEGAYYNGKRDGVWRFYDPDGLLEEVGEYSNGTKEGIWFEGDLQGVPYVDNACDLGVTEDSPNQVPSSAQMIKKPIKIKRINYSEGIVISDEKTVLFPY